eukprot:7177834-Prymnesium_polylepis.1
MHEPFLWGHPSHHLRPLPPPDMPANAEPPDTRSESLSPATPTHVANRSSSCPPSASMVMKVGCGGNAFCFRKTYSPHIRIRYLRSRYRPSTRAESSGELNAQPDLI